MNRTLRILIPVGIVVVAAIGAWALYASRSRPETRRPPEVLPAVRVYDVSLETVRLTVESQGTVAPRTQSALVAEVAGRVIRVAPEFAAGGYFEAGSVLVTIEPDDYREAVVRARAGVAQAELRLAQVQAEADLAREEWSALGKGEATPLTLLEPQLAEARASLEAARAGVRLAEKNLERTEVRAPYDGRVREKRADVGQVVSPGTPLATVYAVDYAEVRLPLEDAELAFLDLPLAYRGEGARRGPKVTLRAEFAGEMHEWEGRVVRTEGTIDPQSRMVHVVARVEDPYGPAAGRPPLAAGLYVNAEIEGRVAENVATIPRAAMRPDGRLIVVDAEDRLHFREVDVLRATRETLIVRGGLEDGERVCVSSLVAATEGMRVRTQAEAP